MVQMVEREKNLIGFPYERISQGIEGAGVLESKVWIIDHLHPVSGPVIETIRRVDNCRS